ncbi:MAG: hypothetical protein SGI73_07420 [Chloroflexota bacterium]|nr:hypothetical protein [Chloroflexota bacterium]
MTQLMERALAAITKLPETEQDAFAAWILDELASEQRWADLFARSQAVLAQMADEALAEHHAGKTQPFDIDAL